MASVLNTCNHNVNQKKMEATMKRIVILLVMLAVSTSVFAGGVIKIKNLNYAYLTPESIFVTTNVNNQVATTIAKQTYRNNTGNDLIIQYGFPLNINASVIDFKWIINGQGYKATITGEPQDTTSTGGPGGNVDHQFLDYLGESPFLFSFNDTLKADSTLETQITFIELLKYRSGEMLYVYPAKLPTFTGQTINRFEIAVTLNSERTITDFNSPSNPDCNIEFGPGTGSLTYRAENISSLQNFSAAYAVSQEEFGVFVTGVKPPGEDGYFPCLPNLTRLHRSNRSLIRFSPTSLMFPAV